MMTNTKVTLLFVFLVAMNSLVFGQAGQYGSNGDVKFRQDSEDSIYEGTIAGKNDAQGNILYMVGGCACGIWGVGAAALSNPEPDPLMLNNMRQTRGAEYAMAYSTAYTKKSRSKNITNSLVGLGVEMVLSTVYYVAVYAATVSEYKEYPLQDVCFPTGYNIVLQGTRN